MELKLSRQPLYINEIALDLEVEQPIECDALLPDYCPDIVRILKCSVQPVVTSRRISGLRVEVEGTACITIHYVSNGSGIARGEYKVPFAKSIDLKAEPMCPAITVGAKVSYVNCRAINQRRLDIRGAINLHIQVMACREEAAICGGEGMGVQMKKQKHQATQILGQTMRESHFSEMLELSYGKAPIQTIVRHSGCVKMTEFKITPGKAIVKGEVQLHVLYMATTGAWEQMEFTLPLNAVVEVDGLDENSVCDVSMELLNLTMDPAQDSDGEYRCLQTEAVVLIVVRAHSSYEAETCADCYSTRHPCTYHTKNFSTQNMCNMVRDSFTYKETMPLPDNIESIIDLWCEVAGCEARMEAGGMSADGRVTVAMFAMMKDGDIYYFDKPLEIQRKIACEGSGPNMTPRMTCHSCSYSFISGDTIEIRCEMLLEGVVYATQKNTMIDEVTIDDKKPKTDMASPGLYLYLPDDGETMWDIAKRYNTSIDKIMEENGGQPSEEKAGVLLIPVL